MLDKESYPLEIQELPRLSDIYPHLVGQQAHEEDDPLDLPHFAFSSNVEMYLHSSGSTGFPKPIPYSHAVMASHARFSTVLSYFFLSEIDRVLLSVGSRGHRTLAPLQ
jgi:acyl-coenzyme A synthetase/AMP-(fatty) acid ligase